MVQRGKGEMIGPRGRFGNEGEGVWFHGVEERMGRKREKEGRRGGGGLY